MPPRKTQPSPLPPRTDALCLGDLTDGEPGDLASRADLDGLRFTDLRLEELTLIDARLSSSALVDVSATETDLRGARLTELQLDRVSLPVVRAARGRWRDVHVHGRIGSVEAYESEWRSVRFHGCKISYLNLRGAEVTDLELTDCLIDELDLGGVTARRISLRGCRIDTLGLRDARLRDADLRGAHLGTVDGIQGLRGATIDEQQLTLLAPQLARLLGVDVVT